MVKARLNAAELCDIQPCHAAQTTFGFGQKWEHPLNPLVIYVYIYINNNNNNNNNNNK
jgi:hypothetical protein